LRPDEVWKMDLHTPQILRDRGRTLEATLAGDAVEVYLKILQTHLCTSLLISHSLLTALGMLAVPAYTATSALTLFDAILCCITTVSWEVSDSQRISFKCFISFTIPYQASDGIHRDALFMLDALNLYNHLFFFNVIVLSFWCCHHCFSPELS